MPTKEFSKLLKSRMGGNERVRVLRFEDARTGTSVLAGRDKIRSADPKEVLLELFELLETYGPTWYREDHHNRIMDALMER